MSADYRELLIGCGRSRDKRLWINTAPVEVPPTEFVNVTTLDADAGCNPDIVFDLAALSTPAWSNLLDDEWDEVHAYEVLEHLGGLGNEVAFFFLFEQLWRILKPGGHLLATVPSRYSPWLWGDPGHKRAILQESLIFLDQSRYPGAPPMSDYRAVYRGDFHVVRSEDDRTLHRFVLKAIKPSRWVKP